MLVRCSALILVYFVCAAQLQAASASKCHVAISIKACVWCFYRPARTLTGNPSAAPHALIRQAKTCAFSSRSYPVPATQEQTSFPSFREEKKKPRSFAHKQKRENKKKMCLYASNYANAPYIDS